MLDLVTITFPDGSVHYTDEYKVAIEGTLWPRQLAAASDIVQRYKECSREDKKYPDNKSS